MKQVTLVLNESVNGIPFFTQKQQVRDLLGKPDYNSFENRAPEEEVEAAKKMLEGPIKELYKKMGKDPDSFEWPDISEFDSDIDTYGPLQLEYDKKGRFVSVNLLADELDGFELNGNQYSDFKLKTLLSLADDFVKEEDGASYISYSKQIGIWVPLADGKVESVLFGCPGYYTPAIET